MVPGFENTRRNAILILRVVATIMVLSGSGPLQNDGEHSGVSSGHQDPVVPVLLVLIVIVASAKLGGELFERMNQSGLV